MQAQENDFENKFCQWIKSKNDKDIYNVLHELERLGVKDKIESSSSNQPKVFFK